GCSGLTSITIPNSVTSIGAGAFNGCSGLSSITIGESVDTIGKSAFEYCRALTSVTSLAKIPPSCNTWGVFSVHDTLYVPQGSRSAYRSAQEWRSFNVIEDGTRTIVVEVNDASMGRVVGDGDYVIGEEATLEAIPNTGYHFVRWSDGNTDNPRALTVTEDITLMAIFAIDTYTVTAYPNERYMGWVDGGGSYTFGAEATLEAIPNEGYHFDQWSDGETANPRTLTVTEDITLTAIFAANESPTTYYTVRAYPNNGYMGWVDGGGEYEEGEWATLEAHPKSGYYFVRWDDGNTHPVRSFVVTQDITLIAIFEEYDHTANEASEADNFRVYVQDRTIYLSEDRGAVQVYNMAGQCVYNGHATAIPVKQSGVYVLVANDKRIKVAVK
ncbi:MAG: leucine-rich repeat protein, partial [Bacteroidales bacterium]|nr:leucine-rich repeat protein [Bacteroidales bacterium]